MNKKIAMSGLSIVAALTLMGGATYAAFSSDASNPGNTFGGGTLDLKINGVSLSGSTPVFTVPAIGTGQSVVQPIILSNGGTVNSVSTKLVNITHTGSVPDLGDKLTLELIDDIDGNGVLDLTDPIRGTAHITDPAWANIDLGFGLGSPHRVFARVTLDASTDNTYQGKTSNFSLNFSTSE